MRAMQLISAYKMFKGNLFHLNTFTLNVLDASVNAAG